MKSHPQTPANKRIQPLFIRCSSCVEYILYNIGRNIFTGSRLHEKE